MHWKHVPYTNGPQWVEWNTPLHLGQALFDSQSSELSKDSHLSSDNCPECLRLSCYREDNRKLQRLSARVIEESRDGFRVTRAGGAPEEAKQVYTRKLNRGTDNEGAGKACLRSSLMSILLSSRTQYLLLFIIAWQFSLEGNINWKFYNSDLYLTYWRASLYTDPSGANPLSTRSNWKRNNLDVKGLDIYSVSSLTLENTLSCDAQALRYIWIS